MSDPLTDIAAEGTAQAARAASPLPSPSWFAGAWAKLRAPSPRSEFELSEDLVAGLMNGFLNSRTAGAAGEARLGEAVMDCVYALAETGGLGAASPLGRLFRAVKTLAGKLLRRGQRPPPTEASA